VHTLVQIKSLNIFILLPVTHSSNIQTERIFIRFYYNNAYAHAQQCYVTCTHVMCCCQSYEFYLSNILLFSWNLYAFKL